MALDTERYAIAVDLDGTLAEYDGWKGIQHIGDPISEMVCKVKQAVLDGKEIWIFTARLAGESQVDSEKISSHIHKWLAKYSIPYTDITCTKHKFFKEFWDDRAKGVVPNTGLFETEVDFYANDLGVKEKPKTVGQSLAGLGELFDQRNTQYGSAYKQHGNLMTALFPNGIELKTVEDFNRFGVMNMICSKLMRYSHNFENNGHVDSLDDLSVYSQMLQELDNESN